MFILYMLFIQFDVVESCNYYVLHELVLHLVRSAVITTVVMWDDCNAMITVIDASLSFSGLLCKPIQAIGLYILCIC